MPSPILSLLLVRHGLTDWNETGRLLGRIEIGLNARGRAQAEAVAAALRDIPLHAVFCSPQRRAQETAAPLASRHGVTAETEPALDEVWLGRWQGKTFADISDDPDLHRYITDPTYVCDAVESAADVRQRVVALVDRLQAEFTSQTVALVSHGDPLRILLAHHLSIAPRLFRRLTISPGSVSLLSISSRASRLQGLNWKPGATALEEMLS
jgi:broad specificity phosphatase PhoE